MAEEVGIVMSLYDQVSPMLKTIAGNTRAFDKSLDDLEQGLKQYDKVQTGLTKDLSALKKAMEESNQKVIAARKEYKKLNDEASKGALDEAIEEQAQLKRRLTETESAIRNQSKLYEDLYSKARQAAKGIKDVSTQASIADNRAGGGSSGGAGSVLSALGKAGLMDMAGDVALDFGNLVVGSTFGSEVGGVVSSGISGALSGAAMGSLLGPVGTAVGAAIGGGLGLLQGGSQAAQGRDDAFKQYYSDLYDTQQAAAEESLSAGGDTASQRELDAIAFNRLLGQGVGDQYLEDLRTLAADTPMEYGDLTSMSRALATGFGDAPDRMLELMTAIGDAGSAVGVTASDMEIMAQAMSRMNSSGKATLEYLNIFQDRGVDVIGMLADAMGKTQGEIYDMISGGDINGQEAVNIIQAGMESMYGGAMETMAQTFDGLTSTLEDAMTEIDNAMGEGYNERAKEGLQADIDAYGGALGDALAQANEIIGEGKAIAENLDRQYSREALSALTLGTSTTVYGEDQANRLAEMHDQYTSLVDQYQNATEEDKAVIASQIEALKEEAQAMADSAYDASEMSQELHDVNLDLITAIRENTAALGSAAWGKDYEVEQEKTKGTGSTLLDTVSSAISKANSFVGQNAWGLDRVPYDNYLTYLHEGERVLTASQARAMDQGGSAPNVSVTVSGNTFGAGMDETAVAEAIADTAVRKILAGYRG